MDPRIVNGQNRLLVNNISLESNFMKTRNEGTRDMDFEDFGIEVQVLP
jgi:hypothetical protein